MINGIHHVSFKCSGEQYMLRQMAWNTFKHTGNVNTFIELIEIENIQKNMEGNQYGNIEDKGDNNSRKQYERLW